MSRLLDVKEAADRLGTTERHVRTFVEKRQIRYLKVGRKVRFRPEDVDALIEVIEPIKPPPVRPAQTRSRRPA